MICPCCKVDVTVPPNCERFPSHKPGGPFQAVGVELCPFSAVDFAVILALDNEKKGTPIKYGGL